MEENNKKVNTLALISMILSLVGLVIFGIPCGIAALVTGIIGLVKFNPETEKGKGMAIAGIVVGSCDIVMVLIWTIIRTAAIMS